MPSVPVIDVDEPELSTMDDATRAAEENQAINEVSPSHSRSHLELFGAMVHGKLRLFGRLSCPRGLPATCGSNSEANLLLVVPIVCCRATRSGERTQSSFTMCVLWNRYG